MSDSGRYTSASLDCIAALPYHGNDGAAEHVFTTLCQRQIFDAASLHAKAHTGYETLVEGLVREVLVMLFEVFFRRADKLHCYKLVPVGHVNDDSRQRRAPRSINVPTLLEPADDIPNETTLRNKILAFSRGII